MRTNMMSRKEKVEEVAKNAIGIFRHEYMVGLNRYEIPELTDEILAGIVRDYFNEKTLTAANESAKKKIDSLFPSDEDIDWSLDKEELKKTESYIRFSKNHGASCAWYRTRERLNLEKQWVNFNGKTRTDEDAAELASDKWCELLFGWHMQDNGAINEDHPGGFRACALGTILANDAKSDIPEEAKQKAKELMKSYYLHQIHYERTHDVSDIRWAEKNIPDPDKENPFDWRMYEFRVDLSCDYGPSAPLYIILINAGIPENKVEVICPWKTSIVIREVDNAVFYNTYGNRKEL